MCPIIIFHDGDVLESRYAVLRRDRTIHGRMREYLQVLCEKEELETICLPIADGMTISTKKEMERESNSWTIIEKAGGSCSGKQFGSVKNSCLLWCRCGLYRR